MHTRSYRKIDRCKLKPVQDFQNKVAVITGGASGIGRAMAERFARAGMRLVLADIEDAALQETAAAFRAQGTIVLPARVDVTKPSELEQLADLAYREFGAVHLLCNNAGVISEGAPVWEESLSNWDWVLNVNFWGVLHGVRAFTGRMLYQGDEGHIVNTASLAGLTTRPLMSAYNVSKHAVIALSECLFAELRMTSDRLHVSVLCPMFARTRLAEARRNRPAGAEEPSRSYGFFDALKQVVQEGAAPEEIAEHVFTAVREQRFWILPHPAGDQIVRDRFECILERRNPPLRDLRKQSTALR
jgi:NAD(P)-dependent dehydrogenase (short-subunit alcohol dehydrogenase family)